VRLNLSLIAAAAAAAAVADVAWTRGCDEAKGCLALSVPLNAIHEVREKKRLGPAVCVAGWPFVTVCYNRPTFVLEKF